MNPQLFPWCALYRAIQDAPDALLGWAQRLAAANPGHIERDRLIQQKVMPVLFELAPLARESYLKDFAKIFNLSVSTLRALLREGLSSRLKNQGGEGDPAPDDSFATAQIGEIVLTARGTEMIRYSHREGAKYGDIICTGHFAVEKRILMAGEGEVMVGTIHCPQRGLLRDIILPAEAWESRVGMKRAMPTNEFAWYGTDNQLQSLMVHLTRGHARTVQGTRVLGLVRHEKTWAAVLSDRTLLPNNAETPDLIHHCDGETGVSWHANAGPPDLDTLKEFAVLFLEFTDVAKAASILGWMGACALKGRLSHILTSKFPFLMLWGPKGCGKSSIAELILLQFYGGETPWSSINQLKPFTAILSSALTNLIPFVIDEFKGWSYLDLTQRMLLSETIRNAYDSLAARRGNRDARSQRLYPAIAPLVVAGEDAILEPAAQDRMIEVFLSSKDHQDRGQNWRRLTTLDLPTLGLDYLRWTLNLPDESLRETYETIDRALPEQLKDRIRHNVACMILGLRSLAAWLRDRCEHSIWPDEYIDACSREAIHLQICNRYTTESAEKPPSIVDRMLEYMSSCAENGIIGRGHDFELGSSESPDGVPEDLYLRIQKLFPRFKEWAIRTRYEEEILSLKAFRQQIREEPYFIESNVAKWFSLTGGGATKKALHLDYQKMLAIGLDVDGFVKGKIVEKMQES